MTKSEMQAEALSKARDGQTMTNYPAIFARFIEKGIPEYEIKPRENVFTFHAWKALGRSVKKGEKGVRVVTFIDRTVMERDPLSGDQVERSYRSPHTTVVFHESQTEPTAEREARHGDRSHGRRYSRAYGNAQSHDRDPGYVDPGELAADVGTKHIEGRRHMNDRNGLLDKIRALMSKTAENGCTEHEALAALDKARALMDAYEVTEAELQLTKADAAILRSEPPGSRDPHNIKRGMASAVARFCDCKVWRGSNGLVYCGLQSDAQFATWLLDNLTSFVQAELVKHLMGNIGDTGERRLVTASFAMGCTARISARLNALVEESAKVAASNSRALVVTKAGLIADTMAKHGIKLAKSRSSRRGVHHGAYAAGAAAGERASFGRPVSGAVGTLRLGR